MDKIYIKEIDNQDDFKECEKIQRELIQLNEVGIVPAYLLELSSAHGGLTLGLYLNDKVIGYSFSLAAYSKDRGYYLFSDAMGFYRNYQRKSLGYIMKQVQYQIAKEKGVKKIFWTYDPLLGPNANINIRKVGGTVCEYELDRYSLINASSGVVIPADRFLLDWSIQTMRVKQRMIDGKLPEKMKTQREIKNCANRTIPILFHAGSKPIVFREIAEYTLDNSQKTVLVEIPLEYMEIREIMPELAQDWRLKTRNIFHYFLNEEKYTVTDFFQVNDQGEIRNFYGLRQPKVNKNH